MGTRFGPYELIERLGEGGMAEVWSARKAGDDRVVCIKRVRGDQRGDVDSAERFLREARLLGRLSHPNIGAIYDAGRVDDEYFIEMEYLHGMDLRGLMKRHEAAGPLPPGMGVAVAIEVGRALDHAHRRVGADGRPAPIIHRDVSGANVIVCYDGSVKLVDFGLAKAIGDFNPKLTSTGVFVGTIGYIAPEVKKGAPASPLSDQFALAVVVYEALSGRRMLDRAIAVELPPSRCVPTVPPALDAICLRALAVDPKDRFPSCGEFVAAVEAAAGHLAFDARAITALLSEPPRAAPAMMEAEATVADVPAAPRPRRPRRRPAPSRAPWAIAIGMPVIALVVSLAIRWWRDREVPAAPPAPVVAAPPPVPPTAPSPPPRPAWPPDEAALTPPQEPFIDGDEPSARPEKKRKAKRRRSDDEMQMYKF